MRMRMVANIAFVKRIKTNAHRKKERKETTQTHARTPKTKQTINQFQKHYRSTPVLEYGPVIVTQFQLLTDYVGFY